MTDGEDAREGIDAFARQLVELREPLAHERGNVVHTASDIGVKSRDYKEGHAGCQAGAGDDPARGRAVTGTGEIIPWS